MPHYSALSYSLYLLKNRAQTRHQLEEKLKRKKYSSEDITGALSELEKLGLINDETYARNYAHDKSTIYRRGRWRIAQELNQKGVARQLIDQTLENLSPEIELVAARSLLTGRARLWQNLDRQKRYLRAISLLSRRGFSASVIKTVLKEEFTSGA